MSGAAEDSLFRLNDLFIAALLALAQTGRADAACRLAAEGCALLRRDHDRHARRLEVALHRLVRLLSRPREPQAGG